MSKWQLFSDAGNQFRWEAASDQQLWTEGQRTALAQPAIDASPVPSMTDLLLQNQLKLVENKVGNSENPPMFRTATGKSLVMKQSSIAKARSVLGDLDDILTNSGQLDERNNESLQPMFEIGSNRLEGEDNMSNSMFQTGSGKSLNISSAGLLRAKTLLGVEENYDDDALHGFQLAHEQSTYIDHHGWQSASHVEKDDLPSLKFSDCTNYLTAFSIKSNSPPGKPKEFPDLINTASKPPPAKFYTAGGKSVSVSKDALQRARSLLGNLDFDCFLDEVNLVGPVFSIPDDGKTNHFSNTKKDLNTSCPNKGMENCSNSSRNFTSPLRSSSRHKRLFGRFEKLQPGNNLIKKFDDEAERITSRNGVSDIERPLETKIQLEKDSFSENGSHLEKRSSNMALADITNNIDINHFHHKLYFGEKRTYGRVNFTSPFKKPRSSFVTPLNTNNSSTSSALSSLAPKEACYKDNISARHMCQVSRPYVKEYISHLRPTQRKLDLLPAHLRKINPCAAESYTFLNDENVSVGIGFEAFYHMMSQSGASVPCMSKEWISNHYKWIIWKLASYERCFPGKFLGKLLTIPNVLKELQYRYEREVNHGHRSAIKKLLDGDAPPSSMMVLCISSVCEYGDLKTVPQHVSSEETNYHGRAKIELTDGWYSLKALLDEQLSKNLVSGKLFLGQKLRIWRAKLSGWIGPVSPLEGSQEVCLMLHINGTYRCHWGERLGFCKNAGVPLAFRCIKGNGGAIPSTLVGITRIYPLLYSERFSNGNFIVRSDRLEAKVTNLFNQRRSVVAEGIMSAFQWETNVDVDNVYDGEEGAKIMKLLETSAEPEILMSGMSSKQLTSFVSYKSKLEAMRQINMQKSIEKALEGAGLNEREVTPFLRVRVVGLTDKCHPQRYHLRKGLITVWNPTMKQKQELCEGKAYCVGGVVPTNNESDTLYLQARGSTTNWKPLSPLIVENFEPFFTPRSPVKISNLGKVSLSSEFDIAAFVVSVGEVYVQGSKKKQWVFVTDGLATKFHSKESLDVLLAISFCMPQVEYDSFAPINYNVAGSVVGFLNLIKKPRDRDNGLWVAESTENSDYLLSFDKANLNHLKDVAASVSKWAKASSSEIEKLKECVDTMIIQSKEGTYLCS